MLEQAHRNSRSVAGAPPLACSVYSHSSWALDLSQSHVRPPLRLRRSGTQGYAICALHTVRAACMQSQCPCCVQAVPPFLLQSVQDTRTHAANQHMCQWDLLHLLGRGRWRAPTWTPSALRPRSAPGHCRTFCSRAPSGPRWRSCSGIVNSLACVQL